VAKARLLFPEKSVNMLSDELMVNAAVIKKIEKQLSFDEDHAVA